MVVGVVKLVKFLDFLSIFQSIPDLITSIYNKLQQTHVKNANLIKKHKNTHPNFANLTKKKQTHLLNSKNNKTQFLEN